jgi:hypothetical protein
MNKTEAKIQEALRTQRYARTIVDLNWKRGPHRFPEVAAAGYEARASCEVLLSSRHYDADPNSSDEEARLGAPTHMAGRCDMKDRIVRAIILIGTCM